MRYPAPHPNDRDAPFCGVRGRQPACLWVDHRRPLCRSTRGCLRARVTGRDPSDEDRCLGSDQSRTVACLAFLVRSWVIACLRSLSARSRQSWSGPASSGCGPPTTCARPDSRSLYLSVIASAAALPGATLVKSVQACSHRYRPGIITESLHTLYRRNSALYLRPQASVALARFLLGFAWNTRPRRFLSGLRALADLSSDAVAQYRELQAQGVDTRIDEHPYLRIYRTRQAADATRQELERLVGDRVEVATHVLDGDQLCALKPCLKSGLSGYLLNGQITVDPSAFVDSLAATLRDMGVHIHEGARVTALHPSAASVVLHATDARYRADVAVLTAGIWSPRWHSPPACVCPSFPARATASQWKSTSGPDTRSPSRRRMW